MQYNISDGITSEGIVLDGSDDFMIVLEGGIANNTTVKVGFGHRLGLYVSSGGTANKTTVNSGGWMLVSSGGTANNTTVNSGGMMAVFSGGTANDTIVYSGGSLDFYPSATINRATVNFGGKMRLNELDAIEIKENGGYVETVYYYDDDEKKRVTFVSNTFSGIELINNSASVHSGTTANNTIVNSSGMLIIWDGGVANGTTVKSGGRLFVCSGGTANDTFIIKKESIYDFGGVVESGGTANRTTLDDGMLCISSGGTANNTIINFGGYMYGYEANNTIINSGGSMYFYEANNTIVNSGGELEVSCMASNTYINSGGSLWFAVGASATIAFNPWQGSIDPDVKEYISYLDRDANVYYGGSLGFLSKADVMDSMNIMSGYSAIVYSGGIIRNTKIYAAGTVEVLSGGKLTGKMNFLGGAIVSVEKGAILDFDLTQTAAGGKAILNNWSLIQGTPDCVLTVGASQASGIYKLADNADDFDGTITIKNTVGESLGTLALDQTVTLGDTDYTLTVLDGILSVAVGTIEPVVPSSPTGLRAFVDGQDIAFVWSFDDLSEIKEFIVKYTLEGQMFSVTTNGTNYVLNNADFGSYSWSVQAVDFAGNESAVTAGNAFKVSEFKPYTVEYSTDNFEHTIRITVPSPTLNAFRMPGGTYRMRVMAADTGEWLEGDPIEAETFDDAPQLVKSDADGNADVFFATPSGTWDSRYAAKHTGFAGEWAGTGEVVSACGKGRIRDLFFGSADPSTLFLTDSENGDALFLDDVFTGLPEEIKEEQPARLFRIQEIYGGAGDDIVDMTSQRCEYIGDGLTIRGGDGDDVIWAVKGDNMLFGDDGNDRIVGASGNDVIVGGIGNDSMHGGGGDDVFAFCDNWGADTVEQLETGTVTLWFASGDESNWNEETLTYTDGENSVTVSGVTAEQIMLKFGSGDTPEDAAQFAALSGIGAFDAFTSQRIFEESGTGILA
ncbi:MAG: AIDA repeat-containing protein [Lentisphaeria bacterium]|nr:AIDA repeat-containing protein [Lentisphaeria bacterium]